MLRGMTGFAGLGLAGLSGNTFAATVAGDLDTSFATAGKYLSALGGTTSFGPGIALQANGSLVIGGKHKPSAWDQFAAFRLNSAGQLDTSFGSSGLVQQSFGSTARPSVGDENAKVVTVQFDGKLLVGGEGNSGGYGQHGIMRLNTDGSLDTSFGGTGKVVVNFGRPSHVHDIKQQADGKLLAIGDYYSGTLGTLSLARLNLDGTLDTSFATAGKFLQSFGETTNGHCVTPLADGRIIASGYVEATTSGLNYAFFITRLTATGVTDTSFGTAGSTVVQGGSSVAKNYVHWQIVQPDGKILCFGGSVKDGVGDIALMRFTANGVLDTSFGSSGIVLTDFTGTTVTRGEEAATGALQPDGKILVAGYSEGRFVVARYSAAGVLDTSFGSSGKTFITIGTGGDDFAKSMLLQPDGKIAVAGYSKNSGNYNMAVVRLVNDTMGFPLATSDAERLFRWAELRYPTVFPPGAATQTIEGYTARYYAAPNNYLGIKDGYVYVLGATWGGLLNAGLLSGWITTISREGY